MVRVALITGASRGIGAASRIGTGRDTGTGWSSTTAPVHHRPRRWWRPSPRPAAKPWRLRPTSPCLSDVTAMVDEIDKRWGGTDVLVHNAMTPFAITSFAELTGSNSAASWTASCMPRS